MEMDEWCWMEMDGAGAVPLTTASWCALHGVRSRVQPGANV